MNIGPVRVPTPGHELPREGDLMSWFETSRKRRDSSDERDADVLAVEHLTPESMVKPYCDVSPVDFTAVEPIEHLFLTSRVIATGTPKTNREYGSSCVAPSWRFTPLNRCFSVEPPTDVASSSRGVRAASRSNGSRSSAVLFRSVFGGGGTSSRATGEAETLISRPNIPFDRRLYYAFMLMAGMQPGTTLPAVP